MEARELSDKYILEAMRRTGGNIAVDHPVYGTFRCQKRADERPLQFIERFRSEYDAWFSEQDYKANRKARDAQDRSRPALDGPGVRREVTQPSVQEVEGSLEDVLKSQVDGLRARRANLVAVRERADQESAKASQAIRRLDHELAVSEKFLKELQEEEHDTSEVHTEIGADIYRQVGQGDARVSDGVGSESSAEGNSPEGQGSDTGD